MTIYSNLVALYLDRAEYEQALEASDKAIKIHELLPRKVPRLIAGYYINRAIALIFR